MDNIVDRKIDYALVITAQNCNPNGNPVDNNIPRTNYDGYGEISDVCLKRKVRNRWQDMGEDILLSASGFGQPNVSVQDKIKENDVTYELLKKGKNDLFADYAKRQWIDVRGFGAIIPTKTSGNGLTIGIRGCATIGWATSLEVVDVKHLTCTSAYNLNKSGFIKDSNTIHPYYMIEKGVYVAYGSIFPQLASINKFTYDDAEKLKFAISTIFENDAAQARPSGSMGSTLYWWEHISKDKKQHPSIKVHRSLNIKPIDTYPYFECNPDTLDNIKLEVLD